MPVLKGKTMVGLWGCTWCPQSLPSQPRRGGHGSLSVCEDCSMAGVFPCAPGSTQGSCWWKWLQAQLLSHPFCRTHLWTAAHTVSPHVPLPREANQMKLEATTCGKTAGTSHFDCWAGRRPWTFPVLARPLSGFSLFYNKSKFYTLSELIWIGFGEKSIAPAEVHWLHWKNGSFPHVKKWQTVGAIVRDRQNSNSTKKTLSSLFCKDTPQQTQFKALDDWKEKVWGGTHFHSWFLMLQSPDRMSECTFCAFAWTKVLSSFMTHHRTLICLREVSLLII